MKSDEMVGLFVIEQSTGERSCTGNASIKEFSAYKAESEILFFPFSCFEIKKIEKLNDQEFEITLNYLGKYDYLFQGEDPRAILERVPENSKIAKQIFSAQILDPSLKIPKWAIGMLAGGVSGAVLGAYTGSIIGSILFPGVGTSMGALFGASIGGVSGGSVGAYIGSKADDDSD